ncbi:hypothetical protein [Flexithrix dorotheae]|uniref:hypothetical protein n=1 Tax=Flexithrix dorotheae TaxID=70993 RepID=UPI000376E8CF|nr:hypothetical protein [Flexithrix dorotheae]
MKEYFSEHEDFSSLLRKSHLELKSDDFDERVMNCIEKEAESKSYIRKYLSFSMFFLIIGISGAFVAIFLIPTNIIIPSDFSLILKGILFVIIWFQVELILKSYRRYLN